MGLPRPAIPAPSRPGGLSKIVLLKDGDEAEHDQAPERETDQKNDHQNDHQAPVHRFGFHRFRTFKTEGAPPSLILSPPSTLRRSGSRRPRSIPRLGSHRMAAGRAVRFWALTLAAVAVLSLIGLAFLSVLAFFYDR